ncbi:MAG: polysaccharide deacetylase family protein [Burkholderiales bacterium]|nr:polysaccharide deacetylase family protein [Burkholderiales bacterium]
MSPRLPMLMWPGGSARLTILFYHRVLAQPDPLRNWEFDASAFAEHMALIAERMSPLPLLEAVDLLRRGKLPKRACCVTFDDGYADNLTVAWPILQRYRVPATVFVATAYLDGGRMFNDTLTEMVARCRGPLLDVEAFGLGRYALNTPLQRRQAVSGLLALAKRMPPTERDATIAEAVRAVGLADLPDDLMLTTAQLRELAGHGVEIGGHTHSHAILTTLDASAAEAEVEAGRHRLESIIGRKIRAFAYPNGIPGSDYAGEHAAMVRRLGFECAVSTARGVATAECDSFQLPRFQPWTSSALKLAAHLVRNAWAGGASQAV